MAPRTLSPGGSLKGSPYDVPSCHVTPTFSGCEKVGPNGCELGTWFCPIQAVSYIPGGRFLDAQQDTCLRALYKIREKAVAADLSFSYNQNNFCEPPRVWKEPKKGLGGLLSNIAEGLTSGDFLKTLTTLGTIVLPTFSFPLTNPESFTEQLVIAAGESIGIKKDYTKLGLAVGEVVLTGGGKTFADDALKGAKAPMATSWFDDLTSGIGDFFSGTSFSDILGVAAPIVQSTFAPQPQQIMARPPAQSFVPTYNALQFGVPNVMQATPVMAGGVAMPAMGSAIARMVAPILFKISQTVGRNVSLQKALTMARSLGKQLQSPAAAAAALGITLAELANLIVAGQHRKRRRMNPANSKALRKAARRIESFHRLCARTDMLRSRGRRRSVGRCGSCKKSPCRC